jgi:hypothetical protein
MMTQRFVFLMICLIGGARLHAQQEMMLNSLQDVWHSNATNPAFFPEGKKRVIGLPSYGIDAAHSGTVSYRDVFVKNGDRTYIDFGNAISKLDPENQFRFDQRLETFSLGFKFGPVRVMAGHANRFTGAFVYPKSLPELLWNGNAPYVGKEVNVALKAQVFDWNEFNAGASVELGNLELGARVKYLSGATALRTDDNRATATLYTSPDIYQLTMKTDYGFYSSSIISAIDTSGLGYDLSLTDLKGKLFSSNRGVGFDIGARLKVTDKIVLSASALDLGATINWDANARYFLSNGSYEYTGVSFPGVDIINGTDSLDFETKLDTLNDIFKFNRSNATFSTRLPTRYYASLSYQLTQRFQLGVSFFMQQGEQDLSAVGAQARWAVMKWLSLGAMYSVNDRSAANLGFHLILKPGPVQFYFLSDNLINAFTVKNASAANLRFGGSLSF